MRRVSAVGLRRSTLFCYSVTEFPVVVAMFPVLVFVPTFFLLACAIIWRYPITERVHAQLRQDLARQGGGALT